MNPSIIDIRDLAPEGIPFDTELELGDLTAEGAEPVPVRSASIKGEVRPGNRGADLQASVTASIELACSRCVEAFTALVAASADLVVVPKLPPHVPGDTEIDEAAVSLFAAPEGRIDLTEVATEQIYLALPLKPLCDPDCRGLCPTCGSNRNRLECDCREDPVDPRLAALEALRPKREQEH